jgi:large subunit ribosomal protein L18e
MRETNTTNQKLQELIVEFQKKSDKSNLARRIAEDLSKPTRQRREVNLTRINKFTEENDVIVVPGKVLGGGELSHKITISAFKFSQSAILKLQKSGSKVIPMHDIAKVETKGKKIRIIG